MVKKIGLILCLFAGFALNANASLITVEQADASFANSNNDLATFWGTLDADDITTEMIAVATMLYSGSAHNNTIFKMTLNLASHSPFTFDLFAGLDAGRGSEVYQNGTQLLDQNSNIWWARNWGHSHVMSLENLAFAAGMNQLVVYWAENYNSGGNSFEFAINDGERLVLSDANLRSQLNAVPEPESILLFACTLIGLMLTKRKKSTDAIMYP